MKKLLSSLWNTAPGTWWKKLKAISRTQKPELPVADPQWHTIINGHAKDYKLYLVPEAFAGWQKMIEGIYDDFLFSAITDYNSKVVLDIGAHFGYSSLVFSKLVGDKGFVYAFEPNKANYLHLLQHIRYNEITNVGTSNVAISDKEGIAGFSASDDIESSISTGSHLCGVMAPRPVDVYEKLGFVSYQVETRSIDLLVENDQIQAPDIIKIDVEGAEYKVLQGAQNLLRNKDPELLIEVHNILAMYDILNLLHQYKFRTSVLDRENSTISRTFIYCYK